MKKITFLAAVLILSCMAALVLTPVTAQDQPPAEQNQQENQTATAEPLPAYVGTQVCAGCHKAVHEEWLMTPHRRTLAEGREMSKTGCESCHGPGGPHVASGGDPTKIIRLKELTTKQVSDICLKCHNQQDVLLYRTSQHAMAKVKCTNCHDVHMPGRATMLTNIEAKQYSIKGLARQIEEARQKSNIATDPEDKASAVAEVERLEANKSELEKALDVMQTRTRNAWEPQLCYTCHKEQEAQFKLPTHHPIPENRMTCSGCHNVHGGARRNLREETVSQTCFKCHQEIEGPYVFEHPPVAEDCTHCHRPHGSAQNYLLTQSDPFLCQKCHAGPHSRGGTFSNGDTLATTSRVPYYYWQCTSCHNRPHGSDRHPAFHY